MKAWKKYLTGILALALVVGMVSLLPHIHGEEFDEDEYSFSEEAAAPEIEDVPEPEEPEEPEEPVEPEESEENPLDGGLGEVEAGPLQPAKLTLVPRELTEEEQAQDVTLKLWMCERACTLTNAEGKSLQIQNCKITGGDMEYEEAGFTVGVEMLRYRIGASDCYLITGNIGTNHTNIVWGDNLYVCVMGTGVQSVLITRDGISVQGTNMNCEIYRNTDGTSYKTILHATNASQAVLMVDENENFQLWSDGAYTAEVYNNGYGGGTVARANAVANSVYQVQNAATDSPQFTRVDVAE